MEYGVAGLTVLLAAVGLLASARGTRADETGEIPALADLERRAFGFALVAVGLHGLIDFPLRIPVLALIAAAWAGLWVGTRPAAAGADSAVKNG